MQAHGRSNLVARSVTVTCLFDFENAQENEVSAMLESPSVLVFRDILKINFPKIQPDSSNGSAVKFAQTPMKSEKN
jgi:hypothetical protein